jgi:hypothetical protein
MSGLAEPVAQTNLQLYAQLRRSGWPAVEIEAVGRAYALATDLLAGWYRASGKPFVDHFVGTASVTVAAGCSPTVVRAALLHNAYGAIVRPDGASRIRRRQRREVRDVIGVEAEALVYAYRWMPWDDATVADLLRRAGDLDARARDVLLIRLANEVDDRIDLGLLHDQQERLDTGPIIELAERLDEPLLADALRRVVAEEEAAGSVEPGLRNTERIAIFRAPRSHRPRLGVALRAEGRWFRRQARRVSGRLKRR